MGRNDNRQYDDWKDAFGNNFTQNDGLHNIGMAAKNIETDGGYQARVSGMYGEFSLSAVLKSLPDCYHVMDDILLQTGEQLRIYQPEKYGQSIWEVVPRGKGGKLFEVVKQSTQIDHIVVSPFGIFVIETKNHKGMIFGDSQGEVWTQVLVGRRGGHHTFYSPVKQNEGHVRHLSKQIKVPVSDMTGIIVFTNPEANLMNVNCTACMTLDAVYEAILGFQNQIFNEKQVEAIIHRIEKVGVNNYSLAREHERYVQDLKKRHEINKMLKASRG